VARWLKLVLLSPITSSSKSGCGKLKQQFSFLGNLSESVMKLFQKGNTCQINTASQD
jgi:hypothetical protein